MPVLPPAVRRWVEQELGASLLATRPLHGGITSLVDEVTVRSSSGTTTTAVLRRWPPDDPEEPRPGLEREPHVLQALEGSGIPAPRLLATDDGGRTDGVPALLMSRVPGEVDLAPEDPRSSLTQMAEVLLRIQELAIEVPAYVPSPRPGPDEVPSWAERQDVWRTALAVLEAPPPPQPWGFTHGDFQHFNLLWTGPELSGVVDWAYPCVTSPDLDVGHCRLNLAVLHGPERAEAFRAAYEAAAGRRIEPWWDLHRLTGYSPEWQDFIPRQVAGRVPVDVAAMTARVEQTLEHALRRL